MEARLTLRRLLSLAAIAAAVATTSACGGGTDAQAAPKDQPLQTYTDRYVSFSHPAAWTASAPKGPSELHFQPLVYLSTQPVASPCSKKENVTTCGWPIKHLEPGGVIALWQLPYSLPGLAGTLKGTRIQVGGSDAWRTETPVGSCRAIGADQTIEVSMPAHSLALTVCLRGPGLAQAEKSVDALLASTKFLSK
jgi:hypothetical protein